MASESNPQEPRITPLPNVVASYREDLDPSLQWEVVPSVGDFNTGVDFAKGIVSVPLSGDDHSRLVRLREMVRLRIAPTDDKLFKHIASKHGGIVTEHTLRLADLGRINAVTRQYAEAFEIPIEPDGSEKVLGKRLATTNTPQTWNKCVEFTAQYFGTKAFDSFASGVRSVNSDWSSGLRKLAKELSSSFDDDVESIGNTKRLNYGDDVYGPSGFNHSVYAASSIANYMADGYRAPQQIRQELAESEDNRAKNYGEQDPEEILRGYERIDPESQLDTSDLPDDFEFITDPDEDEDSGDIFGPLIFNHELPLTVEVKGYMARKRRANIIGRSIVYPSRRYTDPEMRMFANKMRTKGGIYLLDVSGSMHVDQDDIEAIVDVAPAALIMAYSDPDNGGGLPNAHILAKRGWRVKGFKDVQRGGNGVDGTALTWAIRHKKPGEDIVWVTDGQVFGIQGYGGHDLSIQCAKLVKKHRIIMIPSMREAIAACRTGKPMRQFNKPSGRVRDALLGKH